MSSPSADRPASRQPAPASSRRIVFVVGSGRSGTSTMSGILQTLGMHVPQPEVTPDETNPKGFGEPQWVVDLHDELLKRSNVAVSDARPGAWLEAGKLATVDPLRDRLHTWLEQQFEEGGDALVIKDPRLAWFMGLWRAAAIRAGAEPTYITMLRPVTEVVGSKQRHYNSRFGEVNRTAAWVNMMLHTERATRGSTRAFVRYHDLLSDWTVPVFQLGERLHLDAVQRASANDIRAVHQFIDPSLRRVQLTWDDMEVPARLQEIAEESSQALSRLADEDGDIPEVHATLDELRAAYSEFYEEAEAVTQSTVAAVRRAAGGGPGGPGGPGNGGPKPPEPEPSRVDVVPHKVRAMIPASVRRGARKALGKER